jgi:nucleolar protein 56
LKYYLITTELGLLLLDSQREGVVDQFAFSDQEDRTAKFLAATSGELTEEVLNWLKSKLADQENLVFTEAPLVAALTRAGLKVEAISDTDSRELSNNKINLLVVSGLAPSKEVAEEAIRNASFEISNLRIKELSAKPDLQAMESVQALDEIDKTANIVSSRVREWYGLHFPELISMIDDNASLIKLISKFRTRSNYDEGELEQLGYSKNKSKVIAQAAKESRGADIREEDLARIIQLAEEAQHLFSLRDKLASHVERTMKQVAPNLSELAGATIGARLVARAGGLEKLAMLPASTIQILGAEKALYRAMKSGSRPPKHGILFQHAAVHSAPKWQRGKIARSVAGKIAIAARIDQYRGSRDPSVEKALASRLEEIKVKYKDQPAPRAYAPAGGFRRQQQDRFRPRRDEDRRGPRFARGNRDRSRREPEEASAKFSGQDDRGRKGFQRKKR